MKAREFIEMQKQDIETHKDQDRLSEIVAAMSAALQGMDDVEIDHTKSAEECYKKMYEHARKHQQGGSYYFGMSVTMKFIREYLGVSEEAALKADVPTTPTVSKRRRRLEDFF